MKKFAALILAIIASTSLLLGLSACENKKDENVIRIGVVDPYTTYNAVAVPFREVAKDLVAMVNSRGGINGKKLEILFRDDKGKPDEGMRVARELIMRDKVDILMHQGYSHVGRALAVLAGKEKILYIGGGGADSITLESGNLYSFDFETPTYALATIMMEQAAKLPGNRIAVIVPNMEFGQNLLAGFKDAAKRLKPNAEFVAERLPALGKITAGTEVMALEHSKPDIILVGIFGSDYATFIREARKRGLFRNRVLVGAINAIQEEIDTMGAENPVEWTALLGFNDFVKLSHAEQFEKQYGVTLRKPMKLGTLYGYGQMSAVITLLEKLGGVKEPLVMAKALEDMQFLTPVGYIKFRDIDHRSTLGTWAGRIIIKDGKPEFVDYKYYGGEKYMTPPEIVKQRRPQQ